MRYPAIFLVAVVAGLALAQGVTLDKTTRLELSNCPSTGGDGGAPHAGTLPGGKYVMRVLDETTSICIFERAAGGGLPTGCADGGVCASCSADGGVNDGEKFPAGTVMLWTVPASGAAYSCRATGTGDVVWTSFR